MDVEKRRGELERELMEMRAELDDLRLSLTEGDVVEDKEAGGDGAIKVHALESQLVALKVRLAEERFERHV
eukprot:CAMPEP_0184689960 /NCGR_PEP_ID=MMETSP0312-20130426/30947_1 /TAXON_ID=31354 /ORGANISM="Compsopogon coeruleus, Strain SAG 36.94" /LENGTH=70 /DNA_ID=CAMNT_0027147369 /DNA_START=949 /DNA_END=1157 /DNA_ORIENTATION=+